jgi:hypothetical protein
MTRTTEEGLMNSFRFKALALVAGVAALSLTACSTGVTTASSASSPSSPGTPATSAAAPSQSASAAASSPGPAPSASSVVVTGQLGSFPVPVGAKVADNVVLPGQVIIIFSLITPAQVLAFYTAELPREGYRISSTEMVSEAGGTAAILFTGHGFSGTIAAVTNFTAASGTQAASIPGLGHKNVTSVELTQG